MLRKCVINIIRKFHYYYYYFEDGSAEFEDYKVIILGLNQSSLPFLNQIKLIMALFSNKLWIYGAVKLSLSLNL